MNNNRRGRPAIASQAMACKLIEQVAGKHGFGVTEIMAARGRAHVAARAEAAHRLCLDVENGGFGWSTRRTAAFLGCTHTGVRKLLGFHNRTIDQARRWLPDADLAGLAALERSEALQRAAEAEEENRELKRELERLSGMDVSEMLAERLGLVMRAAILLAILVEAYPRQVREETLIALYDDACERFNYGRAKTKNGDGGASSDLNLKNISTLRRHFLDRGWPEPVRIGTLPGSRVLTQEAALWLHGRFGSPRPSQIGLHREIALQRAAILLGAGM